MTRKREWSNLDDFLKRLVEQMNGDYYTLLDIGLNQLSPYGKFPPARKEVLQKAFTKLEYRWGNNFMRRGRNGFAQSENDPIFVADSYRSAYLLIVILKSLDDLDHASDRLKSAHNQISEMIVRLPQLGGGGNRMAQMVDPGKI